MNFDHQHFCRSSSQEGEGCAAETIEEHFPGALVNTMFVRRLTSILFGSCGYHPATTLLATSLCVDEVCRSLEQALTERFRTSSFFTLGGLTGVPFGGEAALAAMASHVPDEGNLLLVYAPHIGVDRDGGVGMLHRKGHKEPSACCGSARAAAASVLRNNVTGASSSGQQASIEGYLRQNKSRIESDEAMVPMVIFEGIKSVVAHAICSNTIKDILDRGGKVAVCGGLQINTSNGAKDYFLPLHFEVRQGKETTSHLDSLLCSD